MVNIAPASWASMDAAEPPFRCEPDRAEKTGPDNRLGTVLVVDDEVLVADTITDILSRAGFGTFTAYSAHEALQLMGKIEPDCVLSDVIMPDMNGVELAVAIRKICRSTKVFLFSGQAGISRLLDEARHEGLDFELIAKPIHPEKLVQILRGGR